jgi:hypothetical protein
MALEIEVVVEGSMHGSKFLQRARSSESVHRTPPSSEGLIRVLRPIVDPLAIAFLASRIADRLHRRAMRAQIVGHDRQWIIIFIHQGLQQTKGCVAIATPAAHHLRRNVNQWRPALGC